MIDVRPAERHETLAALQRVFQHLSPDDALTRLRGMLALVRTPGPEQPQLLVVADGERVTGAILFQPLIGGTGILWPPQVVANAPDGDRIADALVSYAVAGLHAAGSKNVQAVLSNDELPLAAALVRGGFIQPTQLVYLRHELELAPDMLCAPERLHFHSYRDGPRDIFHRVLLRTYEQTRDFPEMNGRRTLDDILTGLQSAGYDAGRWWLATDWSGAVGVLALNEVEADVWEVAYVGIAPEARRKGRGRELMRKALFEAKAAGAHELILSVDARNEPALQLYRTIGFESYDRRSVYLLLR